MALAVDAYPKVAGITKTAEPKLRGQKKCKKKNSKSKQSNDFFVCPALALPSMTGLGTASSMVALAKASTLSPATPIQITFENTDVSPFN